MKLKKIFMNIIKNPLMQVIIITIILILIFSIILKIQNNNFKEHFADIPILPGSTESVTVPPPPVVSSTGVNPDKIENIKQQNIGSLPDREIYSLIKNINIKDIIVKYFELKYNEIKQDPNNKNNLLISYNDKNIPIDDFISKYLSIINTINVPGYDDFLKNVFESDEINTILKLNNFNDIKELYRSLLNVTYLFQKDYYDKIIKIQPTYYSVIFKKFNTNYAELGYFSNKLYLYLQQNIGDTKLFNNAITNSYNFIYNIYNNQKIVVKSIFNVDYNTKKEEKKMNYCDIFFDLLKNSPTVNLPNFVNTLGKDDYEKNIDQFNNINKNK